MGSASHLTTPGIFTAVFAWSIACGLGGPPNAEISGQTRGDSPIAWAMDSCPDDLVPNLNFTQCITPDPDAVVHYNDLPSQTRRVLAALKADPTKVPSALAPDLSESPSERHNSDTFKEESTPTLDGYKRLITTQVIVPYAAQEAESRKRIEGRLTNDPSTLPYLRASMRASYLRKEAVRPFIDAATSLMTRYPNGSILEQCIGLIGAYPFDTSVPVASDRGNLVRLCFDKYGELNDLMRVSGEGSTTLTSIPFDKVTSVIGAAKRFMRDGYDPRTEGAMFVRVRQLPYAIADYIETLYDIAKNISMSDPIVDLSVVIGTPGSNRTYTVPSVGFAAINASDESFLAILKQALRVVGDLQSALIAKVANWPADAIWELAPWGASAPEVLGRHSRYLPFQEQMLAELSRHAAPNPESAFILGGMCLATMVATFWMPGINFIAAGVCGLGAIVALDQAVRDTYMLRLAYTRRFSGVLNARESQEAYDALAGQTAWDWCIAVVQLAASAADFGMAASKVDWKDLRSIFRWKRTIRGVHGLPNIEYRSQNLSAFEGVNSATPLDLRAASRSNDQVFGIVDSSRNKGLVSLNDADVRLWNRHGIDVDALVKNPTERGKMYANLLREHGEIEAADYPELLAAIGNETDVVEGRADQLLLEIAAAFSDDGVRLQEVGVIDVPSLNRTFLRGGKTSASGGQELATLYEAERCLWHPHFFDDIELSMSASLEFVDGQIQFVGDLGAFLLELENYSYVRTRIVDPVRAITFELSPGKEVFVSTALGYLKYVIPNLRIR